MVEAGDHADFDLGSRSCESPDDHRRHVAIVSPNEMDLAQRVAPRRHVDWTQRLRKWAVAVQGRPRVDIQIRADRHHRVDPGYAICDKQGQYASTAVPEQHDLRSLGLIDDALYRGDHAIDYRARVAGNRPEGRRASACRREAEIARSTKVNGWGRIAQHQLQVNWIARCRIARDLGAMNPRSSVAGEVDVQRLCLRIQVV